MILFFKYQTSFIILIAYLLIKVFSFESPYYLEEAMQRFAEKMLL
jgi:hypothetical protein